jgi:hypothetical protein
MEKTMNLLAAKFLKEEGGREEPRNIEPKDEPRRENRAESRGSRGDEETLALQVQHPTSRQRSKSME